MVDGFVPLASLLRDAVAPPEQRRSAAPPDVDEAQCDSCRAAPGAAVAAAIDGLAMMRCAASEALQQAAHAALQRLGEDVIGRELRLAAVDIDRLVRDAVTDFADMEPLAVALSPPDAAGASCALPVHVDRKLAPGDFVVTVRDGALESPLHFRLHVTLQRAAQGYL